MRSSVGVFAGWNDAFPLSAPPSMPPDGEWIFGTDADGRDLFAVIVYGTLLTLKIGVIAGCLGLGIGTTLAFIAAYHGGWLDAVMRVAVDVLLTIPTLLVLVVIASVIHRSVNTTTIGIIIALLAWREPARQIRSQVLVMREAQYVKLAILNGASAVRIIFLEMMPNLLPFLGANLVVAISQAVLASIGLEALGLGAIRTHAWPDDLLDDERVRLHAWPVVVDHRADRDPDHPVRRPVPAHRRPRRDRQSPPASRGGPTDGPASPDLDVNYRITRWRDTRGRFASASTVAQGERLGLVGESGSGKTTTALALMQMLRDRPAAARAAPPSSTASTCWRSRRQPCANTACAPSATSRKVR